MANEYINLIDPVISLAKQAGTKVLEYYHALDKMKVEIKADTSPLTAADIASQELIVAGLLRLTPNLPIISEEYTHVSYQQRKEWTCYWLVDPLDGTKEFLRSSAEFAINIALIENHRAVLGICYAPVSGDCYFAHQKSSAMLENNQGDRRVLATRPLPNKPKIAVSRYIDLQKLQPFLANFPEHELVYFGSSLKMCLVAAGLVDIYPRFEQNCEWDTAAGQIIVEQAGGVVVDLNLHSLAYNNKESLLNPNFLVLADKEFNWSKYLPFFEK
jgi:3'(2'), 5'-bisphosphate nucleotidase